MEHIMTCCIENVGDFEYYLTKTIVNKTITTYGVAIRNVAESYTETVNDIWTEKEKILEFIRIIAKNQVTCVHLKEICQEFVEDLYSI